MSSPTHAPRVLDLGCGREKLPGAVGMDTNPLTEADVLHDLDDLPWPFDTSSFDFVRAQSVLEHVANFIGVVEEIHRVARPDAIVEVTMPFMSSFNYATDPTHLRAATSCTFDYFDPRTALGKFHYSNVCLELVEFRYRRWYLGRVGRWQRRLDRLLLPVLQRNAITYEHYFANVYPVHEIQHILRVRKDGPHAA